MAAYYNECDPFAAAWLRELITAGLIADGEVDARSIADVSADDVRGFTQCHWFAGIGGWSYALRLAGWDDDRPVWTGSCPCQPFSSAGTKTGGHDPRDLWPRWLELVAIVRPSVVFGEQVEAAIGHGWFDRVCDDLEAQDYAVGACCLPAASVGAFHIRQRLWFVAESRGEREQSLDRGVVSGHAASGVRISTAVDGGGADGGMAESDGGHESQECAGNESRGEQSQWWWSTERAWAGTTSGARDVAESDARRCRERPQQYRNAISEPADGDSCGRYARRHGGSSAGDMADADGERRTRERVLLRPDTTGRDAHAVSQAPGRGTTHDLGDPAILRCSGIGGRGTAQVSRTPESSRASWADVEWLPCRDGKARPTQPGLFPLAHGISARVGRLRGYGNAIVPQVAAAFIAAYLEL